MADLKIIYDENNVLTSDLLVIVADFLKLSKKTYFYINSHDFKILNYARVTKW